MSDCNYWIARYYNNKLKHCIVLAQVAIASTTQDNVDMEVDVHCFWIDSIVKGAARDGVILSLNMPEC